MATYVNDLRLKEIATGDEAGTWGTSTNTNLELIGEALGYGTQDCFSTDADATTTVADGATDPARAMYFKVTSSATLTATRTLTIAPNTISRVMFIENATTGSQSINISQGSGANVTIATGKTVVVYLDGAGSGAAVVDALALVDPGVTDTLAEVLVAGNASSGTNIELTTTDKVQFRDSAIYLNSSADGQLDIVADTEVQIAATTIDINGNVDISGTTVSGGKITADAGIDIDNINIDGTTIALSSGDLLFDVAGDITLDAGGGDFIFSDDATEVGRLRNVSAGFQLQSSVSNKDLVFAGSDAGVDITALTLDMSAAGFATFKSGGVFNEDSADSDFRVESNGNTHALFVDAGNDRVGILNSSPSTALDVTGTVTADDVVVDDGTVKVKYSTDPTSTVEGLQLTSQASTTGRFLPAITWGYADSSPDFSLIEATRGSSTGGRLHFATATTAGTMTERVLVDEAGDIAFYDDSGNKKLYWDASVAYLGVGSVTPNYLLDVEGSGSLLRVNATSGNAIQQFSVSDTTSITGITFGDSGSTTAGSIYYRHTGDSMAFSTAGVEAIRIQSDKTFTSKGAAVFNEDSDDADFRIESDSNTHAFFLNAGNGRIGLNQSDPSYALHIGDGTQGERILLETSGGGASIEGKDSVNAPSDSFRIGHLTGTNRYEGAIGTTNLWLFTTTDLIFKPSGGERFRIGTTETVVNEASIDYNFRVESNNQTHALFVDAGNDRVGIFNSSPAQALDVAGNILADGLEIEAVAPTLTLDSSTAASLATIEFSTGTTVDSKITHQASTGVMTIDSGRNATWNGKIEFITDTLENLAFSRSLAVFNEDSNDIDFRVESDNNTHAIFVDAGNDVVGVNEANPNAYGKFTVTGTGNLINANASSGSAQIRWFENGTGRFEMETLNGSNGINFKNSGGVVGGFASTGNFRVGVGNTFEPVMQYTNSGRVAGNPGFTFNDDLDTGMYNPGAQGSIAFSSNGTEIALLSATEVVFNESSNDQDFRVESNNNTGMLFIDGGNDAVGIGTTSANAGLHVLTSRSGSYPVGFRNSNKFSGTPTVAYNMYSKPELADSAALSTLRGIDLDGATLGSGATLTNQVGLFVGNLTEGTNNYAIQTAVSAASGRYNLYLSGTADNYIAGALQADGGAVFNEASADVDFRVESDSNTHALFVDAGNSRVGVNVATPIVPFSVAGTPDTNYGVANFSGGTSEAFLTLSRDGSQAGGFKVLRGTTPDLRLYVQSDEASVLNYNGGNTGDGFYIVQGAGTGALVATFDSGNNIIFNDNSGDQDFRVESNNNANMLYVDGANDTVGIGTNSTIAQVTTSTPSSKMAYYTQRVIGSRTAAVAVDGSSNAKTVTIILTNVSLHGQKVDIHTSGHYFNNGANTFYRHTKYYLMSENTNSRINDRTDVFLGGSQTGEVGTPSITLSGSNTWTITIDIGAGYVTDCTVYVEGPGADQITSITFPDQ